MFAPEARDLTDLTKKEWIYIMENYDMLTTEYLDNEEREVRTCRNCGIELSDYIKENYCGSCAVCDIDYDKDGNAVITDVMEGQ